MIISMIIQFAEIHVWRNLNIIETLWKFFRTIFLTDGKLWKVHCTNQNPLAAIVLGILAMIIIVQEFFNWNYQYIYTHILYLIPRLIFFFLLCIYGLVQERRNSIAYAKELRLSCTNPLIWYHIMTLTINDHWFYKMFSWNWFISVQKVCSVIGLLLCMLSAQLPDNDAAAHAIKLASFCR